MEPEEARIVAHICADGCLTNYIEEGALQVVQGRRYHRDRQRYVVKYYNEERILRRQFANDLKKVFGVDVNSNDNYVRTRSKRIYKHIRSLGGGDSRSWFIADPIQRSEDEVLQAWLQGFFDDEATVDKRSGRIRLKSMNRSGLEQVISLLSKLNVPAHLTGPNCDESWYLNINKADVPDFHRIIGFKHPKKHKRCARSAREVLG